jgi:hypothetical protein
MLMLVLVTKAAVGTAPLAVFVATTVLVLTAAVTIAVAMAICLSRVDGRAAGHG